MNVRDAAELAELSSAELFLRPGAVIDCAFEDPAMVLRNRIVELRRQPT